MLQSLEIRNYRNLKHLRIEKLGRVNLVIGKNNTGKTSFLEATSIFLQRGDYNWIFDTLNERGEDSSRIRNSNSKNIVESNLISLSSIFPGRKYTSSKIEISFFNNSVRKLSMRIVKYILQSIESEGGRINKRIVLENDEENEEAQLAFEVKYGNDVNLFTLDREQTRFRISSNRNYFDNIQFVRTTNFIKESNGILWDRIALKPLEDYVIDSLKIIEKNIFRIAYIESESGNRLEPRIPVVRIRDLDEVVPLRSMGDGINRILTIILAMVNCENGYLFIDEFENGLHYSVQEKLWEIIFKLAEQLNIQVFATTHSNDTIQAFTKIANEKQSDGYLIKLRNINGEIDAVVFSEEELQTAAEAEYLDLRL